MGVQRSAFLTLAHISHFQIESFTKDMGLVPGHGIKCVIQGNRDAAWKNAVIHIQHVYCENVCIDQSA